MKSRLEHDTSSAPYRIPAHHPVASARRSRWGIWLGSLSAAAGVVALITLTGAGGATADVPQSLQVGSQAAATTVPTTPPTTVAPTTVPTTVTTTKSSLTSTTTPLTIVIPKSKVSEGDSGASDDSHHHRGSSTPGTDN